MGLNPYYTGIHLHSLYGKDGQKHAKVLILIILEYIYIKLIDVENNIVFMS